MAEILVKRPKNKPHPINNNHQIFRKLTTAKRFGFKAIDLKNSENIQVDSSR